jgi:hypothetical protein
MIQPKTPNLAKLKYPTVIKKAQAEVDKLYSGWVEEDSIREELKAQLKESHVKDAIAFKEAAIAGEPVPEETITHSIEKMLSYQEVRAQHAKSQCDSASRKLATLVRDNKEAVISLAIEKARKGVVSWKEDVDAIANRQNEATQARSEALDGVRMLAYWDLTNEVIKFDPHFPIVGTFTVPSPHEAHLLNMLDSLERAFITEVKEEKVKG